MPAGNTSSEIRGVLNDRLVEMRTELDNLFQGVLYVWSPWILCLRGILLPETMRQKLFSQHPILLNYNNYFPFKKYLLI